MFCLLKTSNKYFHFKGFGGYLKEARSLHCPPQQDKRFPPLTFTELENLLIDAKNIYFVFRMEC